MRMGLLVRLGTVMIASALVAGCGTGSDQPQGAATPADDDAASGDGETVPDDALDSSVAPTQGTDGGGPEPDEEESNSREPDSKRAGRSDESSGEDSGSGGNGKPLRCGEHYEKLDGACVDVSECNEDNGGCGDPRFYTCVEGKGEPAQCLSSHACYHGGFSHEPGAGLGGATCTSVNPKAQWSPERSLTSERFAVFWTEDQPEGAALAAAPYILEYLEQVWTAAVDVYGFEDPVKDHSTCIVYQLNEGASFGAGRSNSDLFPHDGWPIMSGPASASLAFAYDDGIEGHSVAHEVFHQMQTHPRPWPQIEDADDGMWVVEATAEWFVHLIEPTDLKCFWAYAATPHLPLWAANGNMDTSGSLALSLRKYHAQIFFNYLTDFEAIVQPLIDYWRLEGGSMTMQEYLAQELPKLSKDMAGIFADFSARNATWDYELTDGQLSCMTSQLAKYPEDDNRVTHAYTESGSDGWVAAPVELAPAPWASNTIRIDVGSDTVVRLSIAADALGDEGTDARFVVRVVRLRGENRDYLELSLPDGLNGSIEVAVRTDDTLFLVIASVPELYTGFEQFPVTHRVENLGAGFVLVEGDEMFCDALGRRLSSQASAVCGGCQEGLHSRFALSNSEPCCDEDEVLGLAGSCERCPRSGGKTCGAHGTCGPTQVCGPACECDEGYYGESCGDFQPCRVNPCEQGQCSAKSSAFKCDCEPGYTGPRCDDFSVDCWQERVAVGCSASGTAWGDGAGGSDSCVRAFDESDNTSVGIDCSDGTEEQTGCVYNATHCENGCLEDVWLGFDLGASLAFDQVRLSSGWWKKRPLDVEIWVSDSPSDVPGAGAKLVASLPLLPQGSKCEQGATCSREIPDICCPDGRDAAQDTRDAGSTYPKSDVLDLPTSSGRYVFLLMPHSRDRGSVIVRDFSVYSNACQDVP